MTEHKLFHLFILPKDEENLDAEVFDFRIVAETPIDALTKMMSIEDIDYMYDPVNTKIVIEYDGVVY
jgi:hypothetical protein